MSREKRDEMTFKEFFDLAKDRKTQQFVLSSLKAEGFTERQINDMGIERVWKFFREKCNEYVMRCIDLVSIELERKPELAPILCTYLRRMIDQLEKITVELEAHANSI